MKIAVTSQNFKTVTNHAGRARRYIIYDVKDDGAPVEINRLDLPEDAAFHNVHADAPHPIDGVDVVLSASFGSGFVERMKKRNILASLTQQKDPIAAIADYLEHGQKLPALDEHHGKEDGDGCHCQCHCGG